MMLGDMRSKRNNKNMGKDREKDNDLGIGINGGVGNKVSLSAFKCPLCKSRLMKALGDQVHPWEAGHGITIWCNGEGCPSVEVRGWGKNEYAAFRVIEEKFGNVV